ncbi:hypothetical protein GCM10009677_30740 [Sphaerisporangium rubeum]|uniref:Asp23/Gls24 family envelope stress response protein n=1 Tax=Sphaerisporangium rubeum TaxID=321317 RepID=A0A7X0IFF4_9ACTN|nr:Asp23/Gls24 family envelope stress response protein [Sphaerisporangium rubeum]MBB6472692.1 hypothetical protein [Sphaerisporangium rubeum]
MNARNPRHPGKEPAGEPTGARDMGRTAGQAGRRDTGLDTAATARTTGPEADVTTEQTGSHTGPEADVTAEQAVPAGPEADVTAEQAVPAGPEADVTAEQAGELAERIARAVCDCPGVAGLARGPLATHLAGRAVRGVSVLEREVRVAVVADYGRPLAEVAAGVRDAVAPLVPGEPVDVRVEDVRLPSRNRR